MNAYAGRRLLRARGKEKHDGFPHGKRFCELDPITRLFDWRIVSIVHPIPHAFAAILFLPPPCSGAKKHEYVKNKIVSNPRITLARLFLLV